MNLISQYSYEKLKIYRVPALKINIETFSRFGSVSGYWSFKLSSKGVLRQASIYLNCSAPQEPVLILPNEVSFGDETPRFYLTKPNIYFIVDSAGKIESRTESYKYMTQFKVDNDVVYWRWDSLKKGEWNDQFMQLVFEVQNIVLGEHYENALLLHRKALIDSASRRHVREMDALYASLDLSEDTLKHSTYKKVV